MVICTRVALLCLATLESASFTMLIKQYLISAELQIHVIVQVAIERKIRRSGFRLLLQICGFAREDRVDTGAMLVIA